MSLLNFEVSVIALIDYSGSIMDEEEKVNFEMKITGRFKDLMRRQIDEAYRINNRDGETILNTKNEFHGPIVG